MQDNRVGCIAFVIVGLLIYAVAFMTIGQPSFFVEPTPTPTAVPLDVSFSDEMVAIQHRGRISLRVVMKINGKWRLETRLVPGENVFYTREFTDSEGYRFNALTTRLGTLHVLDYDGRWGWEYSR